MSLQQCVESLSKVTFYQNSIISANFHDIDL